MPVTVSCPTCQRGYDVPASFLGNSMRCKDCGHRFRAVRDGDATPASAGGKLILFVVGGVGLLLIGVAAIGAAVYFATRKPDAKTMPVTAA